MDCWVPEGGGFDSGIRQIQTPFRPELSAQTNNITGTGLNFPVAAAENYPQDTSNSQKSFAGFSIAHAGTSVLPHGDLSLIGL